MIQRHKNLVNEVKKYNATISTYGYIQKIYSTCRYICIIVRYPKTTKYIYVGRGKSFEGFYIGDTLPNVTLRIKDKFLDYFRKYLISYKLMHLEVDFGIGF